VAAVATTGAKEEMAHTRGCCVAPFSIAAIFWLGQNKRKGNPSFA